MKKLIMAVAIVCVAAFAQAASVDWKSTAASAYNGQTMYLLTSIQTEYSSVAEFQNAAIDSGSVAKAGMSYTIKQRTADVGEATTLYFAVLSSDETTVHYVTVDASAYVYNPPSQSPGTLVQAFATVAGSSTTAQIVPEPTSGLLLLLGMAGMALRRRRA